MLFTLLATALTALGTYLTKSSKPPVRRRHLLERLRYAPPVRGGPAGPAGPAGLGLLGGPPVRLRLHTLLLRYAPPVRGGRLGGINFFDHEKKKIGLGK